MKYLELSQVRVLAAAYSIKIRWRNGSFERPGNSCNISPDSWKLAGAREVKAEYEEFDDDGENWFSEIGLKFIDTGKDENGYVEAYSDGASDDFIYDVQDDWNLNFYKD